MSIRKVFSSKFLVWRLLLPVEVQCCCQRSYSMQLIPMGKFQKPNENTEAYMPGQMFLHKVFPYRGVVLHPWFARVCEVDKKEQKKQEEKNTKPVKTKIKKTELYYQVLVDETDSQYVRAENLSVAFLPQEYVHRNSLFPQPSSVHGVDYVAHQDMMPYSVTEDAKPIQHELFDNFFTPVADSDRTIKYMAKDALKSFQENHHPWFCLSDVYKETTHNICITVIPFYMGNQETYNKFWWRYCIRIENLGEETVTLRERNWKIICNSNSIETIHGRGVIGKEPTLTKESPAFQYSSHVSLDNPSGNMWGLFKFEKEDGSTIDCNIPLFNLKKVEMKMHDTGDDIIG